MAEPARPKAVIAGIGIRLLGSAYDLCLLFALCFILFIPVTIAELSLGSIPHWLKGLLILVIAYAYFVGFWVRGGVTTGMRPWKLRVAMAESGDSLSLAAASIRFAGLMLTWMALGMTFVYMVWKDTGHLLFFIAAGLPAASLVTMLLTPERQTLHDLIAGTGVYRLKQE